MEQNVVKLLDEQLNKEFKSAYIYLGISKYFTEQNLYGFASWYKAQAAEEQQHALKIYSYLLENECKVTLPAIEGVEASYESPLAAVRAADGHERYITAEINKIYEAALEAKDYRTQIFLNWFITEQQEEEASSAEMVQKVQLLGSDPKTMYLLDKEVGARK